jgi:hypothetical protein
MPSSLERAFAALAAGLADIDAALRAPDGAVRLLGTLGFAPPPGGGDPGLAAIDFAAVVDGLGALTTARVSGTSVEIGAAYAGLATAVPDLLGRLRTAAAGFAATPDYLARTGIAGQFFPRLFDLVVVRTVASLAPPVLAAAAVAGIVELQPYPADPVNFRSEHLRHVVRWDRLAVLLTDPVRLLREVYGWGSPDFSGPALALSLGAILGEIGTGASARPLPRRVEQRLSGLPVPAEPALQLSLSLLRGIGADAPDVGLSVYALRPSGPQAPDGGIGFTPYVRGSTEPHFALPGGLALDVEGIAEVLGGVAALVRPNSVQVRGGVLGGGPLSAVTARVALRLTVTRGGDRPATLLSIPGGSRVEYTALSVTLGVRPGRGGAAEPFVEVGLSGARFLLDLSGAGPLIGALIPRDAVDAEADLGIGWAGGRAYLRGSADLTARFPVDRWLGPVELQTVYIGLSPGAGGGIPVELTATVLARLGPLEVLVERIGLAAALDFPAGGGNLGPAQLGLGFRPPAGLGASLDAGPIRGGGYLAVDPGGNRYAGVLHLRLSFVAVTAYGIVEQAPGGGLSFVAVLGIRFWPGIQLGFGFALTGVGGLVGLNRRADTDLLRERLASGAAGNVLFCDDPVASAPALLGDLAAFFPAAAGTFVAGPTLQISWLAPIVRLDVAVLIELPGPSKVVILGSVKVLIGLDEQVALLYLRMDFLGVLDFQQRLVSLDAHLVNSHALGIFRLTGGMAFRLSYGDNPYVLLSIGGFHPRFDPGPLNVPAIPRVGAALDVSVVARVYLRLEMYTAFTSNTLQLGARVEAGLELGPISAHGYLSFDALIQFRPFAFDIEFTAGFSVEVFGVSLCGVDISGRLSGPGPLVVHGEATVRLLLAKVSGSVTVELGGSGGDRVEPVPSIVRAMEPELSRVANLRAEGADPGVVQRPGQPVSGVLLSPVGSLVWEQKRAPLDTLVDRFEGAPLAGSHQLQLDPPPGWAAGEERDWFSPGRFTSLDLAASQTMNNATFQQLRSGLRVGSGGDRLAPNPVTYQPRINVIKRPVLGSRFAAAVGSYLTGALAAALDTRAGTPAVRPGPPTVSVAAETFDVVGAGGAVTAAAQPPFQAFQLSRQQPGAVPVPSADPVVVL